MDEEQVQNNKELKKVQFALGRILDAKESVEDLKEFFNNDFLNFHSVEKIINIAWDFVYEAGNKYANELRFSDGETTSKYTK